MMQQSSSEFLQQAYANNWQQYLGSLKPTTRSGWDICVLTASDGRQAAMYERQLEWRREASLLPAHTQFRVIADPGGQRIGSGAATLRVLSLLHTGSDALVGQRILIIHSGGDSRRLPQCSVVGKLFARLPRALPDERASTIFDEFLISLSGLALELPPGVLVASGDVLLVFDHLQLSLRRGGVIGVAAAAPIEMGTHHGVYVRGAGLHRVRAYLHKPPLEQLNTWDAIAPDGTVQIDTGLVWLDAPGAQQFAALTQAPSIATLCRIGDTSSPSSGSALNLYGDLLLPLAQSTTFERYLADTSDGPATPEVQKARKLIWQQVRGLPFTVEQLQPAMFIHFGTSQEYWHTVAADPSLRGVCSWATTVTSWLAEQAAGAQERLALINAAVEDTLVAGEQPALIIDSQIAGPLAWQGGALIANVRTAQPLSLEADSVIHQVLYPEERFVTRIYGLRDDPKRPWDSPTGTFMNIAWADWLNQATLDPSVLWPGIPSAARTLWNARLYPVCANRDESLRLSLLLQQPNRLRNEGQAWLAAPRVSLQESFANASGEHVLADVSAVEDHVSARRFYQQVMAETPAAEARNVLGRVKAAVERRCALVQTWLPQADPVLRLRALKALAVSTGNRRYESQAFQTLADMVETAVRRSTPTTVASPCASRSPEHLAVRVEAAARIDFGGGWTDTPPYSIERGGTVLNAALLLRGPRAPQPCYPIVVEAALIDDPKIVLESQDIEATLEPRWVDELLSYANPADPFALHKAALVMRGIVPPGERHNRPVADLMRSLGCGLRLSTQTSIPRGSGLGTSSILAGAVLECLGQLLGSVPAQAQLFDEVLALEQMMTTGGGWQDQVGGLVGGIKLITTPPGLPQVIHMEPVLLPSGVQTELAARLLVVYTGQQRLAKNLLQSIVSKWMARDPRVAHPLREIARLAGDMRAALHAGDITRFGELLGEHWGYNKQMDPGCTNAFIDGLFEMARPYINGGKLAGAGGGGFAIMIARDAQAAQACTAMLTTRYPGTPVAVWECEIPGEGMVVHSAPLPPAL
ncbi:MAG: hypothetical protein M1546_14615 [Chloroflexi bacterium]|nr:hypothetical protein [Chloroflexota bacterium]